MTREENIRAILETCFSGFKEELVDIAVDRIISLEQQPCGDAVSRAGVFEILGNLISIPYDLDRLINEDDVSESMDEVRAMPPVTPARPKGKWIDGRCNKCGEKEPLAYCGTQLISLRSKYCHNCGAEMESEE